MKQKPFFSDGTELVVVCLVKPPLGILAYILCCSFLLNTLWDICMLQYIVKVHDSDLPCVFSLSVKWQLVFPFHRNVAAASVLYGRMGL